ncbi:glycosyltransferase family 2 protein [Chloroflexota bacterium]
MTQNIQGSNICGNLLPVISIVPIKDELEMIIQQTEKAIGIPTKILAAIPCYDTELSIANIVLKAKKYIDEVIVVNDGSSDRTVEIAGSVGAMVIDHSKNMGYGEAIKSCFEAARIHNADILVILDGDGQHDPSQIPLVIGPIRNGEADLVIGTRFCNINTNIPRYRRFGIKVITLLYNFGSKNKVSDAQSGFRAFSRGVINSLILTEKGMQISVEIIIKAREKSFRMKEVPIACIYSNNTSKLHMVIQGFRVAFAVFKFRIYGQVKRTRYNLSKYIGRHKSASNNVESDIWIQLPQ